jgi:hypothetical protein
VTQVPFLNNNNKRDLRQRNTLKNNQMTQDEKLATARKTYKAMRDRNPVIEDFFHRFGLQPDLQAIGKKTVVVNIQNGEAYDVYIGRPAPWKGLPGSPWQNPFRWKGNPPAQWKVKDREEALAKYESWLRKQPHLLAKLPELEGKRLGCWCSPEPCHGHILAKLLQEFRQR